MQGERTILKTREIYHSTLTNSFSQPSPDIVLPFSPSGLPTHLPCPPVPPTSSCPTLLLTENLSHDWSCSSLHIHSYEQYMTYLLCFLQMTAAYTSTMTDSKLNKKKQSADPSYGECCTVADNKPIHEVFISCNEPTLIASHYREGVAH